MPLPSNRGAADPWRGTDPQPKLSQRGMSNLTTFSSRDKGLACFSEQNQQVARAEET